MGAVCILLRSAGLCSLLQRSAETDYHEQQFLYRLRQPRPGMQRAKKITALREELDKTPALRLQLPRFFLSPPAEYPAQVQDSQRRKQSKPTGSAGAHAASMVSQEDDAMFEANPCSVYLPGQLSQLHAILKSDGWSLVFALLAAARAIILCCWKSRYYEARHLASAVIAASILVVLVAATESHAPILVRRILACKASDTPSRFAAAEPPPARQRLTAKAGSQSR